MQLNIRFLFVLAIGLLLSAAGQAQVVSQVQGNQVTLRAQGQPTLTPLPGAPAPRRGYLWIFGDGSYTQDSVAVKQFSQAGTYDVALYTSDKYTSGGPPPPAYSSVSLSGASTATATTSAYSPQAAGYVRLTSNRRISGPQDWHVLIPQEHTVMILSYGNPTSQGMGPGNVVVGFNPDDLPGTVQVVDTVHVFHGEAVTTSSSLPRSLPQTMMGDYRRMGSNFQDFLRIAYDTLAPGEERNAYLVLRTTMVPDSTTDLSNITLEAMHVPELNTRVTNQQQTETNLLLASSEDPNRILVDQGRMPWQRRKERYLEYTVQFQNEGRGQANMVKIEVEGNSSLDFENIELVDWYPHPPRADKFPTATSSLKSLVGEDGQSATFVFDNVYLPGTRQIDGVAEDSTMGYLTFRVPTNRTHNRQAHAQATIVFDRQSALVTNRARTRLIKAYRPKVMVGASLSTYQPKDLMEATSHVGMHLEFALDRYRPEGWYVVPSLSGQRIASQSVDGTIIVAWTQVTGSIVNIHAQPLPMVKVGMGLTGHLLIPGSETALSGSIAGFDTFSPLGAGFYSQASLVPFRRGPELWLRGQFQRLTYFSVPSLRPELYQLQLGLGYTF